MTTIFACTRRHASAVIAPASFAVCSIATACPNCREMLSQNGDRLAEGYAYSILFMMSMPFVALGGLAFFCWLEVRKARRTATAAGVTPEAPPSEERSAAEPTGEVLWR